MDATPKIEQQYVVAILVFAVIFVIWSLSSSQSMVPMYYGPYPSADQAPRTSAWQRRTQGGLPNIYAGRTPEGAFIGEYDYLGRTYSGLNNVPGNFVFEGYEETSGNLASTPATNVPLNTQASTNPSTNPSASKVNNAAPIIAATPSSPAVAAVSDTSLAAATAHSNVPEKPVPGASTTKIVLNKSNLSGFSANRNFYSVPSPVDLQRWCKGSSCTTPSTQINTFRMFGSAPQDALAESVGTVNSERTNSTRVYDQKAHDARAAQLNQRHFIATGMGSAYQDALGESCGTARCYRTKGRPYAADSSESRHFYAGGGPSYLSGNYGDNFNNTIFNTNKAGSSLSSTSDQPPSFALNDSPVVDVRHSLPIPPYGNYMGFNQVSAADGRSRGV
jgi:hypothetical protein